MVKATFLRQSWSKSHNLGFSTLSSLLLRMDKTLYEDFLWLVASNKSSKSTEKNSKK